jgi:alkanesulfonate monooxygenase SsuD/methylene tetrahydromethanopterin reductase-like flavin-dependent oxidoreductase (luciferase family)
MRIGLQVPRFTWPGGTPSIGPKLAEIGRTADEAGFASLWVMDHFSR